MSDTLRVGLTGGLASGKSTVAELLREAGFWVVDADDLVARLYEAGQPGAKAVGRALGAAYLTRSGTVDKSKVARLVFADQAARERLEAAIHPLVRAAFRELAEGANVPIVLEASRLVEAGYALDFDFIVTVEAPDDLRLQRAEARGLSAVEARARLAAQGTGAERRQLSDRAILNNGSLKDLRAAVDALVAELKVRRDRR